MAQTTQLPAPEEHQEQSSEPTSVTQPITPPVQDVDQPQRPWIHITCERLTEQAFRWLFFWETDPKRLGTLIRFLHHSVTYSIIILYCLIHTIYPSYLLLCVFVAIMIVIWVQHIITGGCVVSKVEQKLLGDSKSFVDPILQVLRMDVTQANGQGLTIYTSTLVVGMSCMELLLRTIQSIKSVFWSS